MAKNYIQNGTTAEFVATADVVSGQVVVLGGLLGVANGDVLAGETGVAAIEGVFELPKVTGIPMNQGEFINFNASTGLLVANGGVGVAYVMADASENDELISVKINAGAGATAGSSGKTPVPADGVTVTVGETGDYATVNDALQALKDSYEPTFFGGKARILILAGTVLSEQLFFEDGRDYSWIQILGVDAQTTITLSALTETVGGSWGQPFIGVSNGSVSPLFNQVFIFDDKSDVGAQKFGVHVSGLGSVLNASATGEAIFGIYNSGDLAIVGDTFAEINIHGAIIDGCGTTAIDIRDSVTIYMGDVIVQNCEDTSLQVDECIVYASGADLGGSAFVGANISGSMVYAGKTKFRTGATDTETDIMISEGSIVFNKNGTGGSNLTKNTISDDGILFR